MSEKIIAWFEKRRQTKAMQLMQNHLALATGAVEELAKAIRFKSEGDDKKANEAISSLSKMEDEADRLRRDISLNLTKGEIPPAERDDLLHLSKRVDMIADWSRESGRVLSATPLSKMPSELAFLCLNMVETVKECVWAVRKCVDRLTSDLQEALEWADKVERLEEKVDEQYIEARRYYLKLDYSKINPGEAILLSQLLDAVENVADWCENTVDQVRVVAVRML